MGSPKTLLILASTSPQRVAILRGLGIPFEAVAPSYVEEDPPDADPAELVRRHAEGKARSVHADGQVTLGVDTTVVLDGRLYGKAEDPDAARGMLTALSGRTHTVVSGLCLLGLGEDLFGQETTEVTFRRLSRNGIETYLAIREWEGRAGAYAIQGFGRHLVGRVDGDYLNVVGLPADLLVSLLEGHAPKLLETA
jgi:septum formation protein